MYDYNSNFQRQVSNDSLGAGTILFAPVWVIGNILDSVIAFLVIVAILIVAIYIYLFDMVNAFIRNNGKPFIFIDDRVENIGTNLRKFAGDGGGCLSKIFSVPVIIFLIIKIITIWGDEWGFAMFIIYLLSPIVMFLSLLIKIASFAILDRFMENLPEHNNLFPFK